MSNLWQRQVLNEREVIGLVFATISMIGGKHLRQVLIVGMGNPLLQDDGVGIHAIQRLKVMPLPPGVSIIDGGTDVLELLSCLSDVEVVIIVDAIKAGQASGSLYRIPLAEFAYQPTRQPVSMHGLHFVEVLHMVRMWSKQPEVVILGIEPQVIDWGMELSLEVEAQLPRLLELIQQEAEFWLGD